MFFLLSKAEPEWFMLSSFVMIRAWTQRIRELSGFSRFRGDRSLYLNLD